MNKHIYRHANGEVSKRNSENRIYTHAVELVRASGSSEILTWCGNAQLAEKQLASWLSRWNKEKTILAKRNPDYVPSNVELKIVEVEMI